MTAPKNIRVHAASPAAPNAGLPAAQPMVQISMGLHESIRGSMALHLSADEARWLSAALLVAAEKTETLPPGEWAMNIGSDEARVAGGVAPDEG